VLVAPESAFLNPGSEPGRLQALQEMANGRSTTLVVGVSQAVKFESSLPATRGGSRSTARRCCCKRRTKVGSPAHAQASSITPSFVCARSRPAGPS